MTAARTSIRRWKAISFASRFLNVLEIKYSVNELELLAVVWALEQFRNYVYGTKFVVITNYNALIKLLKTKGNKTFTSRLTRWVERLLPFEFEVRKGSGKSTGVADYVINCPLEVEEQTIMAESLWHSWFAVNRVTETAESTNEINVRRMQQPIKRE